MSIGARKDGKKYLLYPGLLRNKEDGQYYYINAKQLAELYGVSLEECVIAGSTASAGFDNIMALQALRPQYNGDYSLCQ